MHLCNRITSDFARLIMSNLVRVALILLALKTANSATIPITDDDQLTDHVTSQDESSTTLSTGPQSASGLFEMDSSKEEQTDIPKEIEIRISASTTNDTTHPRVTDQYGIPLPNVSGVKISEENETLGSWSNIYERLIQDIFTTTPIVQEKPKDMKARIERLSNLFESVKANKSSKPDLDHRYSTKVKNNDQNVFHNNCYHYEIDNNGALKLPKLQGISENDRWDSIFTRPEKEQEKSPMLRSRLAAMGDYEEPKIVLLDKKEDFPDEGEELALKQEYRDKVKEMLSNY